MKTNMGSLDRGARLAIGTALLLAAAFGLVGVWGWLGIVPVATGLSGFCPAYLPFGWSTCKKP